MAIEFDDERAAQLKVLHDKHLKGIGAVSVVTWLVGAIGIAGLIGSVWQYVRVNGVNSIVESARQDLDGKVQALQTKASSVLVPPGSILAWPGALPPSADPWWSTWRECDGGAGDTARSLKPVTYGEHQALWAVLRGLYGNPSTDGMGAKDPIMLPDFRGYFLRGLGGVDPDTNRKLGVEQKDAFKSHTHAVAHWTGPDDGKGDIPFANKGGKPDHHTRPAGEDETRPVNYAVHWVIRIK